MTLETLDRIMAETDDLDAPHEPFAISTDSQADWALRKIKAAREQHQRFASECDERIQQLQTAIERIEVQRDKSKAEADRDEEYFKSLLLAYFDGLPEERIKTSKTQRSYKLPEGKLIVKKPAPLVEHDDEQLLGWLDGNGMAEYVNVKRTPKWADVKARLELREDGSAVDKETGEIVPGITVTERAEEFRIDV